ncbi:hypothetical protein GOP47_0001365 [Adiantum capillus-veneris]|uniref:Uncharacterized protein n=1 Tax=Adiantum capillus-veneris TaxID=13818 RepID=A0A9D4ZPY4_ADICA|nr:hypothetical protein GOP47_0001365 [Adiantum capillus-veneris]
MGQSHRCVITSNLEVKKQHGLQSWATVKDEGDDFSLGLPTCLSSIARFYWSNCLIHLQFTRLPTFRIASHAASASVEMPHSREIGLVDWCQ